MVVLRVLGPDDWADWRELRLLALRDASGVFGSKLADWQGDGDTEQRWRARLDGMHNVLAHLDGEPAGMVSGMPRGSEIVLISMWVAPFARGRGVGDALVDAVVRWSASPLSLKVKEDNAPAVALYRRHGFVDAGPADVGERRMVRP
jgi:ribosomal protein S18 acetylase RimI-like enzyme